MGESQFNELCGLRMMAVLECHIPLYWCVSDDGYLLLIHVGGFMFMDNLKF
jgi:hypothetical protein